MVAWILLETQILRPHSKPTKSGTLEWEPRNLYFSQALSPPLPPPWLWCPLDFEKTLIWRWAPRVQRLAHWVLSTWCWATSSALKMGCPFQNSNSKQNSSQPEECQNHICSGNRASSFYQPPERCSYLCQGCPSLLGVVKRKKESEATQSCPTLCSPMNCSLPGSSIHGIF